MALCVVGRGQKIVEITDREASKETGLFWGSESLGRDSVLSGEGLTLTRRPLNHSFQSWGSGHGWQRAFYDGFTSLGPETKYLKQLSQRWSQAINPVPLSRTHAAH